MHTRQLHDLVGNEKKGKKLLNNPTASTTFHTQFKQSAKDVFIIVILVKSMKLNRRIEESESV